MEPRLHLQFPIQFCFSKY